MNSYIHIDVFVALICHFFKVYNAKVSDLVLI